MERRLAAILVADVVGFSHRKGAGTSDVLNTIDPTRTLGKLAANRTTLIAVSAWNPPDQHLDDRARLRYRPSRQTATIRPPHSTGSRQIAAILNPLPV